MRDEVLLRQDACPGANHVPMPCVEGNLTQEPWLLAEEITEHLGVNPDSIYKWIDRKKMPAYKLGQLGKFLTTKVDSWVRAGEAAKGTPLTTENALRAKRSHA